MKNTNYLILLALGAITLGSCKKDNPEPAKEEEAPTTPATPTYTVPTTYDFPSANYTSSTQRLSMLGEMLTYVRTAHTTTASPALSATKLKDMYNNTNAPFANATLNTSGVQLKDKTSNGFSFQADLENILTEVGNVTQTTPTGSNGTAGKVTSGTKAYMMDANGFEYKEVIEKGIMGATWYFQATTILKNIGTYDNTTVVTGQGTAQEHAWDEAFGYFGVPAAFPTTTVSLVNWGSYCNAVNGAIGSNATIMNAWLKGRAAISAKDAAGRDAARDIVVTTWEKVGAARFITYMKAAKTGFSDDAVRNHSLSEAVGFIRAFRYNPAKTISDADITILMGYLGTNLYTVSQTNLDAAIVKMAAVFNLDSTKL